MPSLLSVDNTYPLLKEITDEDTSFKAEAAMGSKSKPEKGAGVSEELPNKKIKRETCRPQPTSYR